jgi:sugar phosphate permease
LAGDLNVQSDESLNRKKKPPKVFPGWWTVISSGLTGLWGAGYYHYGFSAFFTSISAELGLNRQSTSYPTSIGRLEGGLEAPLSGWISDRYGPRWIAVFGVFMFGLSLVLMQYVNSMWSLILIWGVMLGTSSNLYSTPLNVALANWFVKRRGLAMSIKRALDGLSGVLVLPLIGWLIRERGWRTTCIIGGAVMWLLPLPLVLFGIKRHRPEYYGLYPDGARGRDIGQDVSHMIQKGARYAGEVAEVEFTIRQAMRTPAFWLLILSGACNYLSFPIINIHGVPFLQDRGFGLVNATLTMAIMVGVSIPFRIVGGVLADRVPRSRIRFIVVTAFALQALGFGIFLTYLTTATIYIWYVLYGIGMGLSYALFSPLRARYFGRKAFGSIHGVSEMLMTPVGVLAPIYAGWVWDTTGSYIPAFNLVAILLVVSAVLMATAFAPKPPPRITDVTKIA